MLESTLFYILYILHTILNEFFIRFLLLILQCSCEEIYLYVLIDLFYLSTRLYIQAPGFYA